MINSWSRNVGRSRPSYSRSRNILHCRNSRRRLTMKGKRKNSRSINAKYNSKNRWEIDRSRTNLNVKNTKRRRRKNSTISSSKKSNRNSLYKSERLSNVSWRSWTVSSRSWWRTSRTNVVLGRRLSANASRYFWLYLGYKGSIVICQTAGRALEKARGGEEGEGG